MNARIMQPAGSDIAEPESHIKAPAVALTDREGFARLLCSRARAIKLDRRETHFEYSHHGDNALAAIALG
jgi:hypothetical protein